MPGLAPWQKGKKSYIEAMEDQLNKHRLEYGYSIAKYLYGIGWRLEQALNDPLGIDPDIIDGLLGQLDKQALEYREWQLIKQRQTRENNATATNRA